MTLYARPLCWALGLTLLVPPALPRLPAPKAPPALRTPPPPKTDARRVRSSAPTAG